MGSATPRTGTFSADTPATQALLALCFKNAKGPVIELFCQKCSSRAFGACYIVNGLLALDCAHCKAPVLVAQIAKGGV